MTTDARSPLRLLLLLLLSACATTEADPTPRSDAAPPASSDAGDDGDAGDAGAGGAGALCKSLPASFPYVGLAYFARSGGATSGAWVLAFGYAGAVAPAPGAGFAAIVLDREDALVGRPVELASFAARSRGAPLVRPYLIVPCNGAPPCGPQEASVGYFAATGTAIVHEHAAKEGGRFSLEIWTPVLRRNVAQTGLVFSDDPIDCYRASRIHLVGQVEDVTSRCPTLTRAEGDFAYLACELARRAMDP